MTLWPLYYIRNVLLAGFKALSAVAFHVRLKQCLKCKWVPWNQESLKQLSSFLRHLTKSQSKIKKNKSLSSGSFSALQMSTHIFSDNIGFCLVCVTIKSVWHYGHDGVGYTMISVLLRVNFKRTKCKNFQWFVSVSVRLGPVGLNLVQNRSWTTLTTCEHSIRQ